LLTVQVSGEECSERIVNFAAVLHVVGSQFAEKRLF
jgi:hypothetical protein